MEPWAIRIFERKLSGAEFGEHTAGGYAGVNQGFGFVLTEDGDALTSGIADPFDVRKEQKTVSAPGTGQAGSHLIRIDVVDIASAIATNAGDDGEEVILAERVKNADVGTYGATDLTEKRVNEFAFCKSAIDAAEADSIKAGSNESGNQFMVDRAGKNFKNGVHHLGARDAEAVDERGCDTALIEKTSHLFATAVDDGRDWVRSVEGGELGSEAGAGAWIVEHRSA